MSDLAGFFYPRTATGRSSLLPEPPWHYSGDLLTVEYRTDPVFGFEVPVRVPGVDPSLLDPRSTWADAEAYDRKAAELARMFRDNFEKFAHAAGPEIAGAGPRV